MTKPMTLTMSRGMTYAAAPIKHLARRRLWLGLELPSLNWNPASLAILTLIELARDP
jgi:hypothetical protein